MIIKFISTIFFKNKIVKLIFAIVIGFGMNYYYNFFIQSSLENVLVEGCKFFPAEKIKKAIVKYMQENKNNINLYKIQQIALDFDYVKDCSVRTYNRRNIMIHIKEKEPVAKNILNEFVCDDNTVIKSTANVESKNIDENGLLSDVSDVEKSIMYIKAKLLKVHNTTDVAQIKQLSRMLSLYAIEPELCIWVREGRWNIWYKQRVNLDNSSVANNMSNSMPNISARYKLIKLPTDIEAGCRYILNNYNKPWFIKAKVVDLRKKGYALVEEYDTSEEVDDVIPMHVEEGASIPIAQEDTEKKDMSDMIDDTIKNTPKSNDKNNDLEDWLEKIV